jgi:hypothetical protein
MRSTIETPPHGIYLIEYFLNPLEWGRNGFDGIESLCEGVSGSELP